MQTEFQKTFVNDGKAIIEVIELLYPDMNCDWQSERGKIRITAHPYYTCVRVKYGETDFYIDNHEARYNGSAVFGHVEPGLYKKIQFSFSVTIPISDKRKQLLNKLLMSFGYKKTFVSRMVGSVSQRLIY